MGKERRKGTTEGDGKRGEKRIGGEERRIEMREEVKMER